MDNDISMLRKNVCVYYFMRRGSIPGISGIWDPGSCVTIDRDTNEVLDVRDITQYEPASYQTVPY